MKAGKPQAQVAADLGVSQQAVSKIVREEEKKIRSDPAARVTDLLKTVFGKPE